MTEQPTHDHSRPPDPPICTDTLLARCLGNGDIALTVLGHLSRQLDTVERDLCDSNVDAPRLADISHSIRGSAGTVGAGALLDAASVVETVARSGAEPVDVADLLEEVRRCQRYIESVRRELSGSHTGSGGTHHTE
jgi:HPt (histidine-containing phosphotransfer) domain-containing protein